MSPSSGSVGAFLKARQCSDESQNVSSFEKVLDSESTSVRPVSVSEGQTMSDSDPESSTEGPEEASGIFPGKLGFSPANWGFPRRRILFACTKIHMPKLFGATSTGLQASSSDLKGPSGFLEPSQGIPRDF